MFSSGNCNILTGVYGEGIKQNKNRICVHGNVFLLLSFFVFFFNLFFA